MTIFILFSGFDIVQKTCYDEIKNHYVPINVVYFPVKKYDEIIDRYLTDSIHLVFPTTLSVGKNKPLEHACTYQCHGCLFFFTAKNKYENHLKVWTKMPDVIYKFEN